MLKRILGTSLALILTTTSVLATGIPVGCSNGTREEPVPPTIIPGYVEDVPDINHPEQSIPTFFTTKGQSQRFAVHAGKPVCVKKVMFGGDENGMGRNISLKADCLTFWDTSPSGTTDKKRHRGPDQIIPGYVEVTPDIEHPEQVIDNPPLVIPTLTIKWLVDVAGPWWDPTPVYDYTTSDGSCPSH